MHIIKKSCIHTHHYDTTLAVLLDPWYHWDVVDLEVSPQNGLPCQQ
jgi:hypothetical protein